MLKCIRNSWFFTSFLYNFCGTFVFLNNKTMSFSASFLSLACPTKRITRKEKMLSEMNEIVPWRDLENIITPYWMDPVVGRKRTALSLLLRMYFLQQWYNLSDEWLEDEIWNQILFQKFLDINVTQDSVPDSTTLENFRHVLEQHNLAEQMMTEINHLLTEKWILLKRWTIVDATIINAPSSTKNKDKKRDPEMHQTKKGNQWYHGMKAHVGTDSSSGVVHSITTTAANIHDSDKFDECLHGEEHIIFADSAYTKWERIHTLRSQWIICKMNRKGTRGHKLSQGQRKENRKRSSVRARCEHIFHIVKNIFHYRKARYRWLKKNTTQITVLFTLANLYKVRSRLLPWWA